MMTAKQLHLRSVADEDNSSDGRAALTNIGAMLDALDIAQFGVSDAVEALRLAYDGAAATAQLKTFLATEAENQDIVNHLADAARSIRAARALSCGLVTHPNAH
ncbi:hypothetical protein PXH69_21675 [Rhodococcus qingshengii]|uniref:Uncharacterized protein n=1 Tax=Rhodococcus qingshengii TaxID=334542 RepID=A0AAW6LT08_RHOSG|nr:hypothetical protein [Rhodococcus qingshengii]MDE8647588.1 hypothetical protein [Rhodococcus qingshengii]